MKHRLQRLLLVVDHARRRELEASKRWGEAQRAQQATAHQLQQLEGYRGDYSAGRYRATVAARRLQESQRFVANLERAASDLCRRLEALSARTTDAHKKLQLAQQRREALELVVGRYREELERQARRQEQRLSDEFAARRGRTAAGVGD